MNKEEFLQKYFLLNVRDLNEEIKVNHPLLAIDFLLFVNSDLFSLEKEVDLLEIAIIILGQKLVGERINLYCGTKLSAYKKNLMKTHKKQMDNLSGKLNELLLTYFDLA